MEQKSVLFVEHTKDGELSRRLREVIGRMAPMLGFSVKVVERTGRTLKSCFPQSSLWEGVHCGHPQCITCNQGAETLAPCTKKSRKSMRISAVNANLEQGGRRKFREGETLGDHPSMWGKPHDLYRKGGGSIGQQLQGVQKQRKGAT